MNQLWSSIKGILFFTILLGLLYPILVTLIGQSVFPRQANGSLVLQNGQVIGSELIAQKFETDRYFWPRPSAVDFHPLPSGGSNFGPTSLALKEAVEARRKKVGDGASPGLLFASGSGLDPDLDLRSVEDQISRVAKVRGVPEQVIRRMILANTQKRQFGFLGEERVNVLKLNLSLDEIR